MNTLSVFSRVTALGLCVVIGSAVGSAQGYYDDDIYYDASKAKKETKAVVDKAKANQVARQSQRQAQYYYDGAQYVPWTNAGDFQAADTYQVSGTSTRDVDEYNRRTTGQAQTLAQGDSITLEQFEAMSNTRNLARFHDSEEAQAAYADIADVDAYSYNGGMASDYYTTQPATIVNLNVVGGYGYPYYNSPWYWNRWGYDPYYWGYDPFWGPSWGYLPSWSWSWHWGWHGPGWACGAPGWGWGGPHHGWAHARPNYTSAGAFAPNATNRGNGTYRGGTAGRSGSVRGNRSSASGSLGSRPSYSGGTVNRGSSSATSRPGYRMPTNNPDGAGSSTGVTRGRTSGASSSGANTGTQQRRSSYNNNSNNSSRSGSSYNSGSSSRGRSGSMGSFGGGSRGGSSAGGASRGGGGRRGR